MNFRRRRLSTCSRSTILLPTTRTTIRNHLKTAMWTSKLFRTAHFRPVLILQMALAIAACSKQETDPQVPAKEYTYSFIIDEDTKATLDYDGVLWETGDQVGMYIGENHGYANVDATKTPKEIIFKSSTAIPVNTKAYAYFPYATNSDATESRIVINNYQEGGVTSSMPMAGIPFVFEEAVPQSGSNYTTSGVVRFLNLGAIIDFRIYSTTAAYANETVKSITFTSNGAPVSGTAYLDLTQVDPDDEQTLVLEFAADGSETYDFVKVSQSVPVAADKDSAEPVYMALAPGTYSGTIKVVTDAAVYTFTFSDKKLNRNGLKHYNMNLTNATRTAGVQEVIMSIPYAESFDANKGEFTVENVTLPSELKSVWSWGGPTYGMKATATLDDTKYAAESWLVSPWIDLTSAVRPELAFKHAHRYAHSVETELTLWVKTDEEGATWQQLTIPAWGSGYDWTFVLAKGIDLSGYSGHKVKIGFKYKSSKSYAPAWEIKNFRVAELDVDPDSKDFTWNLTQATYSSASTTSVVWTNNILTMEAQKGSAGTNTNNYLPPDNPSTKFYTNSSLVFTPAQGVDIQKVEFTLTTDGFASTLYNSTWTNATVSLEAALVTIVPNDGESVFSAVIGGQTGASKVKVYYVSEGSVIPTSYSITLTQAGGGTISSSADSAEEGEMVTLTATTASGYEFLSWSVVGATLADPTANPATFVMPGQNVTVTATFAMAGVGVPVTFTKADFSGQGTSGTGGSVSFKNDGITVSTNKGYGASESLRVYKNAVLKISADGGKAIQKLEFTFSEDYTGGLNTSYSFNPEVESFERTLTSQARITKLIVTYTGGSMVVTGVPTNINASGATLNGSFSLTPSVPTQAGFEWGTSSNPDNWNDNDYLVVDEIFTSTSADFSVQFQRSLEPNTTYYYRAYILLNNTEYVYGSIRSFSTDAEGNISVGYLGCFEMPTLDVNGVGASGTYLGDEWFRYNINSSDMRKVVTHTFVSDGKRVRNYTVLFDGDKHAPLWAAFPMHKGVYSGDTERSDAWQDDPAIPYSGWQQPGLDNATTVGYSRGHFVASQYRKKNENANLQTFYRSNQAPQWQNGFNSGVWSSLEDAVVTASPSTSGDTLYVVVGVLYEGDIITRPSGSIDVPLPSHFYTCVMKCSFNSSGAMTGASGKAFVYTNESHDSNSVKPYNHADYVTTIDAIESRAGFDFFKNVPDQFEASAENGTSALNL